MPGSKRTHEKQLQRKKALAARAAAQKAAERKRRIAAGGVIVLVVGLIAGLVLVLGGGDDDDTTDVATNDTSTSLPAETTTPAVESAAGKPCVKVADPLPAGAPEVAVEEGPPPEKLIMKDLVEGTGESVGASAQVTVNYIGVACSTGKIFDTSYGGQPATFGLDGVIPGWTQGIPGMKVGGKRLLGIPSALAYGEAGNPPTIAPDEALWFVVEILATTAAPDQ